MQIMDFHQLMERDEKVVPRARVPKGVYLHQLVGGSRRHVGSRLGAARGSLVIVVIYLVGYGGWATERVPGWIYNVGGHGVWEEERG